MKMQIARLPVKSKPAHKAVITPAINPDGEKYRLENNPITPPKNVESTPKYAQRIMPIIGAMIVAAVIYLPNKPTTRESGKKERTAYKAVKQTVKATSFAASFL